MQRHNIRAEHGASAGRFVSQKRKKWRDNVIAAKKKKLSDEKKPLDEEVTGTKFLHEGRRVVELGRLAEDLWCKKCDRPLSLRHVEREKIVSIHCRSYIRENAVLPSVPQLLIMAASASPLSYFCEN